MKIIFDAHLPETLADFFPGHDCIHTKTMEKGNKTKDSIINDLSIKEKRVVFTKDTDFYYSFISNGKPYKLVLVRLGNMRLTGLKAYFKKNSTKITKILEIHSFIILEKEIIRIIV